jgi:hypothetical protein
LYPKTLGLRVAFLSEHAEHINIRLFPVVDAITCRSSRAYWVF